MSCIEFLSSNAYTCIYQTEAHCTLDKWSAHRVELPRHRTEDWVYCYSRERRLTCAKTWAINSIRSGSTKERDKRRRGAGERRAERAVRRRSRYKYPTESRSVRSSPSAITSGPSRRQNVSIAANRSFIATVRDVVSGIADLILRYQKFYETKYNIELIPEDRIKFNGRDYLRAARGKSFQRCSPFRWTF